MTVQDFINAALAVVKSKSNIPLVKSPLARQIIVQLRKLLKIAERLREAEQGMSMNLAEDIVCEMALAKLGLKGDWCPKLLEDEKYKVLGESVKKMRDVIGSSKSRF